MRRHYGGRQTVRAKETERETRSSVTAVDTLAALNYRADYSGRMAPGLFLWLTFTKWQSALHTSTDDTRRPIRQHVHSRV